MKKTLLNIYEKKVETGEIIRKDLFKIEDTNYFVLQMYVDNRCLGETIIDTETYELLCKESELLGYKKVI